jgi:prepilin-type N-terminal cleavage/methylation domain-containing protein
MSRVRRGFTLTELLVVISILVLLTSVVVVALGNTRNSDRVKSAARTAQSTILGSRDRASQAKESRGIRFLRDPNDPSLITSFQYIRPLPSLTYGVKNGDMGLTAFEIRRRNNSPDAVIVAGLGAQINWFELDSNGMLDVRNTRVRIPADESGNWYKLVPLQTQPPYFVQKNGTAQLMQLSVPILSVDAAPPAIVAVSKDSTFASMELQLGNEIAPFTEPMPLPTGMVIDLKWSSPSAQALATSLEATGALGKIDLMFTPRGNITGSASVMGPIHFLIHDMQDAAARDPGPNNTFVPLSPISPKNRSDKIILTIFPATGNVQAFPIDPTDVLNNSDGSAGPDGLADDLFRFARNGSGT